MEACRRRMELAMRQRHEQLVGGCSVTRISSLLPACWSIRRGGSPSRCRLLPLASSVEAVAASGPAAVRRQCSGGGRGRLGPVGNAAWRSQHGEGHRGWSAVRRGTGDGEAKWRGWMGTVMQGGNNATSIRARRRDKRIGSLDERRIQE
jgi:hypothetical protein